jgi:hypothetical protein
VVVNQFVSITSITFPGITPNFCYRFDEDQVDGLKAMN